MKGWIAVALIASLSACAPAMWTKPGATAAEFERDKAECLYEGNKATAADPNVFAGLMANDLASQCLKLRGYSKGAAQSAPPPPTAEQRERSMRQLCASSPHRDQIVECKQFAKQE